MKIIIIGNGISGITAARWIRKLSNHEILVISEESEYFYSRTALMYIYTGHMRFEDTKPYEDWFWKKNNIDLRKARVTHIETENRFILLDDGETIHYDKLILATGSVSNKMGWPGQDLEAVTGLYGLPDLEKMEKFSKNLERAVIVGGGLIGIEMAEMFHSRNIPVTLLVRESQYWDNVLPLQEASMISKHILAHHIDLRLGVNLDSILSDDQGNVVAVKVKETGETISCGFVGLTPGVSPNLALVKNTPIEFQKGILVNDFLETNIPGIYAIGDCAQVRNPKPGRTSVEAVWYTGRMMGETVAHTLCVHPTVYNPGIWFNSAKFFDIEYQVYGNVPNNLPDHLDCIFWQHPNGRKSIRIVYTCENHTVTGFNLLGIRYRQEVCVNWLKNKATLEEILPCLPLANFDPEFSQQYEKELIDIYNHKYQSNVTLGKKRSLKQVFRFLEKKQGG